MWCSGQWHGWTAQPGRSSQASRSAPWPWRRSRCGIGRARRRLGAVRSGGASLACRSPPPRARRRLGGAPAAAAPPPAAARPRRRREVTVALSQWPGHLALVVGNGGLTTQPGSAAAAEGLDLEIVFIEDAPSKNKALQEGKVDAVWETVDELPIAMVGFKAAKRRRARLRPDRLVARRRRLRRQQGGEEGRGHRRAQVGGADVLARPHRARVHAHQLAPDARAGGAGPQGDQLLDGRLHVRAHPVRQGQGGRRVPVGAGRDAGAGQPAGRAPAVLHRRRDRAGRRHAGGAARVPGPVPRAGGQAGARLVRGRQEGRERSPGGRQAGRHGLHALPRRARLRRRR